LAKAISGKNFAKGRSPTETRETAAGAEDAFAWWLLCFGRRYCINRDIAS
jgi:hypothetical protein